jgi:hypothetical protein
MCDYRRHVPEKRTGSVSTPVIWRLLKPGDFDNHTIMVLWLSKGT